MDIERIPEHVAIIMDGNGRWAVERGLPRFLGHKAGAESVREVIRTALDVGIHHLTLYSFSTENWLRPKIEVQGLMQLLKFLLRREVDMLDRQGVSIRAIGRLGDLPQDVRDELQRAMDRTRDNDRLKLYLAISYGGRAEIIDAVNRILSEGLDKVDEDTFRKYLYTPEAPDPDLLIRTGGEIRISNFLLWQIAYTELYFTDVLWPDFRRDEFLKALEDYSGRVRKFGRV